MAQVDKKMINDVFRPPLPPPPERLLRLLSHTKTPVPPVYFDPVLQNVERLYKINGAAFRIFLRKQQLERVQPICAVMRQKYGYMAHLCRYDDVPAAISLCKYA